MEVKDTLAKYRSMRDFKITAEPDGKPAKSKTGHRYLIQKHAATRLHYDFRLELDGALKSWAVTRGPSLDPKDKRLAVEVEDHPVAYGDFEGIIPAGEYGGGTVMLWDTGTWEPIGDAAKGLKNGKLTFRLYGERLKGEWALVRMHGKGRANWLLIKHDDEEAKPGDHDALLEKSATSIISGRKMEQIAKAADNVWGSKKKTKAPSAPKKKKAPAQLKRKGSSNLPEFIEPQLATLSASMPTGKQWVHEVKFDGYRIMARIEDGNVRLLTRTNQDWTHKFSTIASLLSELPVHSAMIDGEVVAVDESGVSSFTALQEALSAKDDSKLQYYAFDLLHINGEDISQMPLIERKAGLEMLIEKIPHKDSLILYSDYFYSEGDAFLQKACGLRMEGVISKLANAPYYNGRSKDWLKSKCHLRQEFVIAGYTNSTNAGRGIGALLIGYYEEGKFLFGGKVGTGFNLEQSHTLRKQLDKLKQKEMPFAARIPASFNKAATWVKPELVAEIEFTEWTRDGMLRHPSFKGLREDKPASGVGRDRAVSASERPQAPKKKEVVKVEGITITHPERIVYPEHDITKQMLAEYYAAAADYILPHIINRPLSILRCPGGVGETCFFQRHVAAHTPHIYPLTIAGKKEDEDYVMIKDVRGLISLVQWGAIEFHPWGAKADRPQLPDRIIFDLDPDPDIPWERVTEAAKQLHGFMRELGLKCFLKTTGGKGLHIVIPLKRKHSWEVIKGFAHAVAEAMEANAPDKYIATMSKEKRKGRIFIDYLRNEISATAVAAYSARARDTALVAMPVEWSALDNGLDPADYSLATGAEYIRMRKRDPWDGFFTVSQTLPAKLLKSLKIKA